MFVLPHVHCQSCSLLVPLCLPSFELLHKMVSSKSTPNVRGPFWSLFRDERLLQLIGVYKDSRPWTTNQLIQLLVNQLPFVTIVVCDLTYQEMQLTVVVLNLVCQNIQLILVNSSSLNIQLPNLGIVFSPIFVVVLYYH